MNRVVTLDMVALLWLGMRERVKRVLDMGNLYTEEIRNGQIFNALVWTWKNEVETLLHQIYKKNKKAKENKMRK